MPIKTQSQTQAHADMVWYVPPSMRAAETRKPVQTAQQVIDYFARKGVTVFSIKSAGVLDSPLERNGWKYVPLNQDNLILPNEAQKRKAETERNFTVRQWIVGHEQKSSYPVQVEKEKVLAIQRTVRRAVLGVASAVATVVAIVVAVSALVVLVSALGTVLMAGLVLMALGVADPQLIAVTESGEWVVVSSFFS